MFTFSYGAALLNRVQILPGWLDIPSQSHNPDIVSISPRSTPVNLFAKQGIA